jgi:hypothetical protein
MVKMVKLTICKVATIRSGGKMESFSKLQKLGLVGGIGLTKPKAERGDVGVAIF